MRHVVMLLSNAFRPDPRVLREAESLATLGYKMTLICWDRTSEMKPEETLESGVHIIRIQKIHSTYGLGIWQLMHLPRFWLATFPLLNHLHPDLIHCHDFDTLPAGLLWGKIHHRPVVYDAHEYYARLCLPRLHGLSGALLYRWIETMERVGASAASAVVTVDETLGSIYRRLNQHVVIIGHYPNLISASGINPVFTRPHLTLIYIGRLSIDRGLLAYATLLRSLRQHNIPARLRLFGIFTSPKEEKYFYDHIKDLDRAVEIMGWIPYQEIFSHLREADIGLVLLQPELRYEVALPNKLFEYMAAGLPVVASNFKPIATLFSEVFCGALVNPLDTQEALNHILNWWEHPDEARAAGESGRQAILEKYYWESLIGQLESLYHILGC